MKVLIAPMAAMAETSGPFTRASLICHELLKRGHEAAFCAAEDVNYKVTENIKNYYAPVPSPLGMPMFVGKRMTKLMQIFNVQEKKSIHSYEQVLHFVGAITYKHFSNDVFYIRKAIRDFKPDIVYAEFRIAAIIASRLEKVRVVTGFSYPASKIYASNPEYSSGVRKFLLENNLPLVHSVLNIFDWADLKIVPSSYELEPIDDKNVVFTGPFSVPYVSETSKVRNKIVAYMGNGSITPQKTIDTLTNAFQNTDFEVYIASNQIKPYKKGNINVGKRFDFTNLMPQAAVYINHGGQNSIMTGLIYGVPQIVCPGNNFERKYNASSVVKLKSGIFLKTEDFNIDSIKKSVDEFISDSSYSCNSRKAGEKLLSLGGAARAVNAMEDLNSKG